MTAPASSAVPCRLTVAVPTYRRPADLAALLPLLTQQLSELADGTPPVTGGVLVVDNDPAGAVAVSLLADPVAGVRVVHEPEPGISAARNRALAETRDADVLVFVDDDERPAAGWLAALVDTWRRTGADAVAGPVVSSFPTDPDPWLVAGGIFARAHRDGVATGTPIDVAATNNLLLDRARIEQLGVRFDPAFGLSGGEDSLFTGQLTRRGGRLVWCAEAVVDEPVPVHRVTRRYALARAVSHGNSEVRVALRLASPARRPVVLVRSGADGALRLVAGGLRAAFGLASGSLRHRARGLRTLARGAGMLGAALGWRHEEYRRKEGR